MNKKTTTTFLSLALALACTTTAHAQRQKKLAEKIVNKKLAAATLPQNLDLNYKKFEIKKDFADHQEIHEVIFVGKEIAYIETIIDKADNSSVKNVFSGDYVLNKNNVVSVRAHLLDGKKIAVPITKVFMVLPNGTKLDLKDANSGELWTEKP